MTEQIKKTELILLVDVFLYISELDIEKVLLSSFIGPFKH